MARYFMAGSRIGRERLWHHRRSIARLSPSARTAFFSAAGRAMEELVAEIGSAFLGAALGFAPQVMENHAAYVDCWVRVLAGDKRAIFAAASHAQKAADFLLARTDASADAAEEPERLAA